MLYDSSQFEAFFGNCQDWQRPFLTQGIEIQTMRPGGKAGVRYPGKKPCYPHDIADAGTSGNDIESELSRFGTADIDVGHSSNPVTTEQVDGLVAHVQAIRPPGLWLSRSGGGKGLHLRIVLTNPLPAPGVTYTERRHAHRLNSMRMVTYLDREYLRCQETLGFSLASLIDCVGGILFCGKRRPGGQELLYSPDATIDVPADYPIDPDFRPGKGPTDWDRTKPVTPDHYPLWVSQFLDRLVDYCAVNICPITGWISLHTGGLAAMWQDWQYQTAPFTTVSTCCNLSEPQSWGLVTEDGQLIVGRYGKDEETGPIWQRNGNDTSFTFIGQVPRLKTVADTYDATPAGKGWRFEGESRGNVLALYGLDGTLVEDDEPLNVSDENGSVKFRQPGKRRGNGRSVNYKYETRGNWTFWNGAWEQTLQPQDDTAESLDTDTRRSKLLYIVDQDAGDGIRIRDPRAASTQGAKVWIQHPTSTTCNLVQATFHTNKAGAASIIQDAEEDFVYRDCRPLLPTILPPNDRYPRPRINVSPVQFVALPVEGKTLFFDAHCERAGQYLTPYVEDSPGCQELGIKTGADWMRLRYLEMFHPAEHRRQLPVVQMFGPHGGAKSSFWITAECFLQHGNGVVNLRPILRTNDSGTEFNSQLDDAILAYSDERNLDHQAIKDRLKEMATSGQHASRRMRTDVRKVESTFSLFLGYNDLCHGVHEIGDRRSVVTYMDAIDKDKVIPPKQFREKMRNEAPAFIYDAINHEPLETRFSLVLPVVFTAFKAAGWEALEAEEKPYKARALELHGAYLLAQWIDRHYDEPFRACDAKKAVSDLHPCFSMSRQQINELLAKVAAHGTDEPTLDKRPCDDGYVAGESPFYDVDWFIRRGLRLTVSQGRDKSHYYTLHRVSPNPRKEDQMKLINPGMNLFEIFPFLGRFQNVDITVFDRCRTLLNDDGEPACHVAFTRHTQGLQMASYIADLLEGTNWHSIIRPTARGLMVVLYDPHGIPWDTISDELERLQEREALNGHA